MLEQTLVLIRPFALLEGVEKQIKQRYLDAGLRIARQSVLTFQENIARTFYADHEGKYFFETLISCMVEGSSIALVLEGENAISLVREMNGATEPAKALPGTIRRDFPGKPRGNICTMNIVHSSDSPEAANREIALLF